MMSKMVNIYAPITVRTLMPNIEGIVKNVLMCEGDIHKLLCGKAQVEEILSDGTLLPLDFGNYNKDNNPVRINNTKEKVVEEIKTEVHKNAKSIMNDPISHSYVKQPKEEEIPEAVEVEDITDTEAEPDTDELVEEVVEEKHNTKKPNNSRPSSKRR